MKNLYKKSKTRFKLAFVSNIFKYSIKKISKLKNILSNIFMIHCFSFLGIKQTILINNIK
jgi:hypothetical protein